MTERKLHLESLWEIWAGDLNCLLWEQRCFVARQCVGREVWVVQKWLSCYCSCWKRSNVTDSKYQGRYTFPFEYTHTHVGLTHWNPFRHMLNLHTLVTTYTAYFEHFEDSHIFYLSQYLRSSPRLCDPSSSVLNVSLVFHALLMFQRSKIPGWVSSNAMNLSV